MKVIYRCELCSNDYYVAQQAEKCEARGVFDFSKFTVGMMFEYYHSGFIGIFAIPPNTGEPHGNRHLGTISYWACRTPQYMGDSLGEYLCGGDLVSSDSEALAKYIQHRTVDTKLNCPEFTRMVDYLRSQGITPSYYDKIGVKHIL